MCAIWQCSLHLNYMYLYSAKLNTVVRFSSFHKWKQLAELIVSANCKISNSFPYLMLQELFVSKVFVTVLLSVKLLTFTDLHLSGPGRADGPVSLFD